MDTCFKSLPFSNLKAEAKGRSRAGIASVFGNIDAVGDRVMPGAFAKTIAEGAKRAKHLWMHSWAYPPTAKILELKELTREELPAEVLEKAPTATGGLLVRREYRADSELANDVLSAIDAGLIDEMSFAYETVANEYVDEPIPGGEADNTTFKVNNLTELRLLDTSDVLYGCNAATVANFAKHMEGRVPPLGVIAQYLDFYAKAGRRNSAADQALIDMMHEAAVGLGCTNCSPKTEEPKAGTALISIPLLTNRLNLARARTPILTR